MATSELERPAARLRVGVPARQHSALEFSGTRVLAVLASLRLTVVLFALAIFLIFASTLAQVDHDVWEVVRHSHFRVWWAKIDLLAFGRLVQIFHKSFDVSILEGLWFPFPGGKLIGLGLLVNLFAAHSVRFKVAASGTRLLGGLGVIALGVLMTALVIHGGMDQAVESELSPVFCNLLWQVFRGALAVLALAGAYLLFFFGGRMRTFEWRMLLAVNMLLAVLVVWLLANPDARLDNSGIRILWQLIKGTAAGVVLLAGCVMVFRKRAGIVLLHGGVALMMLSELSTALTAHESQMTIPEGETVNWSQDIRTTELAIIDRTSAERDRVTVVPEPLLVASVSDAEPIDLPDLPLKIRVRRWLPNSQLRNPLADEANPATSGFGTRQIADSVAPTSGVGEDAEKVDFAAAYVELFSKNSGKSLGTFLASQGLVDQPVEVDGRTFDLALRFERTYYPFTLTLKDFSFDRYVGTDTPKNYSSQVVLKDPQRNVDQEIAIWMNNPLRYAGLTFYQSSFDKATERTTVLQVMKNAGWMAPYVACMLVLWGMLAHFGTILVRFLRRRAEEAEVIPASGLQHAETNGEGQQRRARRRHQADSGSAWTTLAKWFPAIVVLIFAGYVVSKARLPESQPSEMQIHEFGKLPLAYQGRIKPYDTLARNSLQILSGSQDLIVAGANGKKTRRPAIRWLLDAISGAEAANDHRVFRIENLDLLNTLGLAPRKGSFRYSLNDLREKFGELQRQIELADAQPKNERTLYQVKVLQLAEKLMQFKALTLSFQTPQLRPDPEHLNADIQQVQRDIDWLRGVGAPHAAPPPAAEGRWSPLLEAQVQMIRDHFSNEPINRSTIALATLLGAYARGDVTTFNQQLSDYRRQLTDYEQSLAENSTKLKAAGVAKSEILSQRKINFEVFFNQFSPFYYAEVLYLVAFVLGVLSWVGWTEPLRRGSMWLLWFTFALHTFALVARVYISGRPPVTNLYSTAIFIGWGGVLMALVFESIHRLGLGNIGAAVIGFLTLLVAYNLSLDGDTFIVLQAVLDTQFWLATHVVTINLGYAATYTAGLWGALYILLAHVFPVLNDETRRQLARMIYGTLCFAIFFSFIGTVLGGLWADDSWGRFWGWDPKENGALMIVLWNALVLHARWGGLAKGRGLAALVVGGNIVTTWSYFGVNELGVGLHSYGASESSTAMWLLVFAASQLALIGLGAMPQRWFQTLKLARSTSATE